jgi:hypothetical protein
MWNRQHRGYKCNASHLDVVQSVIIAVEAGLRSVIDLSRHSICKHYRKAPLVDSRTSITPSKSNAKYPLLDAKFALELGERCQLIRYSRNL